MTDPLSKVYDDTDARGQAGDWAHDLMREGWSPEAIEAQLRAHGWSADDAATVAENARKQTRHLRGVVTQADVSQAVHVAALNNEPTLLNAGYIAAFDNTQPTIATAAPHNVISYASPPDRREVKRLRTVRINAIVKILSGAAVMAMGTGLCVAIFFHRNAASATQVIIAGGMLFVELLTILEAYREHRSPKRLVAKRNRGLLDRARRD